MIKIKKFYTAECIEKYVTYVSEAIKIRYDENKPTTTKAKAVFETNGCFDIDKVKRLLEDKSLVTSAEKITGKAQEEIESIINYKKIMPYVGGKLSNKEIELFGKFGLRHYLLTELGIKACPYCNKQYIPSYEENGAKRSLADFDHFRPKTKYPQLSLSLYNLIPSCKTCNSSTMKGQKDEKIIFPFDENFGDDCVFRLESKDIDRDSDAYYQNKINVMRGDTTGECKLVLESAETEKKEKIENSIQMFKLRSLYQNEVEYARNLLQRKREFGGEDYLKLKNQFMGNRTESEIDEILYGFHWENGEDIDKPLSKLAYDIVKR